MKHLRLTTRPAAASTTPDCVISVVVNIGTLRILFTSGEAKTDWILNTGRDENFRIGIDVDSTC